jgi:hypothetical protein
MSDDIGDVAVEAAKTAANPYRWAVALVCVAVVVGGFLYYRHSLIQEGVKRERTETQNQAKKQIDRAQEQTLEWKVQANEVDAKNQELQDKLKTLSASNKSRAAGLQQSAPSAQRMAGASAETCGANAAEAESDLGECAVRYSALGDAAAEAAGKAWEFHDKWPAYTEFQGRLETFKTQLKGNP